MCAVYILNDFSFDITAEQKLFKKFCRWIKKVMYAFTEMSSIWIEYNLILKEIIHLFSSAEIVSVYATAIKVDLF